MIGDAARGILCAVLVLGSAALAQEKTPGKEPSPSAPRQGNPQEQAPQRRDPTESDLPRPQTVRPALPAITLKAVVIAAEKEGVALLQIEGRQYRIKKGDLLDLGVSQGVQPPSAGASGTPPDQNKPSEPRASLVLRVAALTASEVKLEVVSSGEMIVLH